MFFDGGFGIGMGIMMFFMMFFWLIFLVLIIIAVIYALRYTQMPPTREERPEEPVEILKARYAKGEITKEQFEEMKKELAIGS